METIKLCLRVRQNQELQYRTVVIPSYLELGRYGSETTRTSPPSRSALRKIAYAYSSADFPGSENSPSTHPPGGISIHERFRSIASGTVDRCCCGEVNRVVHPDDGDIRVTICPIGTFAPGCTG